MNSDPWPSHGHSPLHSAPVPELACGGMHQSLPELTSYFIADILLIQTDNTGYPSSKAPSEINSIFSIFMYIGTKTKR